MVAFGEGVSVDIPFHHHLFGETPSHDLLAICAIVRRLAPRRIFEFGTFTGSTTLAMILNAPSTTEIWTLDLAFGQRHAISGLNSWNRSIDDAVIGRSFTGTKGSKRIHQLFGNSLKFDPQPFRARMDVVFIDASHGYRFVVNDTSKAFVMKSTGGVILWHDYPTCEGVKRHLEELPPSRRPTRIQHTNVAILASSRRNRPANSVNP